MRHGKICKALDCFDGGMNMQKDNLILTERQLARKLGLPYSSVRNLRIQKKMPHFRTAGRIFYRWGTIMNWMDQQEQDSMHDHQVG